LNFGQKELWLDGFFPLEMTEQIKKIMTWNVKGIKRQLGFMRNFIDSVDIICLQETWLKEFELNILETNFPDFCMTHKSGMKINSEVLCRGRPFGGVVTIWKNAYSSCIEVIPIELDNCVVEKVMTQDTNIYVVNAYFLTNTLDNQELISECNSRVISLWRLNDVENILILGDLNIGSSSSAFLKLKNTCEENDLLIIDDERLPPGSFTFQSEMNSGTSWIDHVIGNDYINELILSCTIVYNFLLSDHFPLKVECNIPVDF